ncbi:MAG: CHASE2 domain-containing protein [Chthoniobacterales bacterium]
MHWLTRHRLLVLAGICLFWTGLIFLGHRFPNAPFLFAPWSGEQSFEDMLRREGRTTPPRDDFVFIGIDQSSLELTAVGEEDLQGNRALQLLKERPFPWSREVWALLLDRLFAAGTRVVIFDLVFNPPNDGDPVFHDALERHRDRVVVGANFDQAQRVIIVPNATLIPSPQEQDVRVGLVNFWSDPIDGKVREARFSISERQLAGMGRYPGEPILYSLSARALAKLGEAGKIPDDLRSHAFRFGPVDAYAPRPVWEIFDLKSWQANYGGGTFFKDKVVMIGASAQILHDVVNAPLSPAMHGPALHLHTMAAAMAGEFLRSTVTSTGYGLIAAAGLLAWAVIAFLRRPLISLLALGLLTAAYLITARVLYDTHGFFLLTVPVLLAFLLSGLSSLGLEYVLERLEKLRTRRTLERYVSKNLVKEILENPGGYYNSLLGSRKAATMLFSDIVGFTTLTERADPESLVKQLNEYLTRMVAVVFENNGTLDKFIGDAVMAVWGNVKSRGVAEDAKAAARTALGMRRELQKLNEKWRAADMTELGIGIGINQGEVLMGNIGSEERMEATVIGDAVNLASRLEGLTRTYGVDILAGESASDLIRDEFHLRTVARVQVKGKTQPVDISSLLAARDEPLDAEFLRWLETYEEAIREFRARRFENAKRLLSRFLEFYPEDKLAKMYLERALEYEEQPPDESWTGAEVFTKK